MVPGDLDASIVSTDFNGSRDLSRSSRENDGLVRESLRGAQRSLASSNLGLDSVSSLESPFAEGIERNIARVLQVVDSLVEVIVNLESSSRAEVADRFIGVSLGQEVDVVTSDLRAVRVRSVPSESQAAARCSNLDLRCIGGTSRSPDLSLGVSESTSIASSDSKFVRGGSAVLINRPGESRSSCASLGLPDSAVHLLVADFVKSSRGNVSIAVDVLSIH